MITRLLAGLLVAAGLVAVGDGPATSTGPTVTAAHMAFTPSTMAIGVGLTVTWRFPDEVAHTTTSTQGFWDSGSRSDGDVYTHTFTSAGTYPYVCTFHPMMVGSVRVTVRRIGSPSAGWTLQWATVAGGSTFDVQVRRGSAAWRAFRTGTTRTSAAFAEPETRSVRARTHAGGATSGWSPATTVTTG